MKAILLTQYGSPDVLQLKEVEKPVPKEGEILVKIQAASANPLDWHLMRGAPLLARLAGGLRKPKDPRLGADFAGQVEAVGNNVTQFQPGEEGHARGKVVITVEQRTPRESSDVISLAKAGSLISEESPSRGILLYMNRT